MNAKLRIVCVAGLAVSLLAPHASAQRGLAGAVSGAFGGAAGSASRAVSNAPTGRITSTFNDAAANGTISGRAVFGGGSSFPPSFPSSVLTIPPTAPGCGLRGRFGGPASSLTSTTPNPPARPAPAPKPAPTPKVAAPAPAPTPKVAAPAPAPAAKVAAPAPASAARVAAPAPAPAAKVAAPAPAPTPKVAAPAPTSAPKVAAPAPAPAAKVAAPAPAPTPKVAAPAHSASGSLQKPWTGAKYPPHDGAASAKAWEPVTLPQGSVITRRGNPDGRFFAPAGTTAPQRSLPTAAPTGSDHVFITTRDLNFNRSTAVPAFGWPGGGTQLKLADNVSDAVKKEGIKRIVFRDVLEEEAGFVQFSKKHGVAPSGVLRAHFGNSSLNVERGLSHQILPEVPVDWRINIVKP